MKKEKIVFILVLVIAIIQFHGCLNTGPQSGRGSQESLGSGQTGQKNGIVPQVLSPEETLKIYLNAMISKDIDTVMAYLPNGTSKHIIEWRERAKAVRLAYMSDKKHIIAIESIKLIRIETKDSVTRAILEATMVTTPKFSGAVTCDDQGKCTASLLWTFRQYKQDGPWLYDGGGF